MTPTPFRVTDEDLAALGGDVREGMQPLLGSLNITLNDVVQILTGRVGTDNLAVDLRPMEVEVADDTFPLRFTTSVAKPRFILMNCNPKDPAHSLTTPFVMQGFGVTEAGLISIPNITGLVVGETYSLSFLIL